YSSIAFHVARIAQQEGARLVVTGYARLTLVERIAKRLPDPPPVIELDVADEGHLGSLADRVSGHLDGLDGVVHAIGFAPQAALGGNFLETERADVDAAQAWPGYDWMGVAKAGLESCARYLARDLGPRGVRVNLVSAGPLRTMAARSIPGFDGLTALWDTRAPLGWDINDAGPAARACVALLSDWFPATTGEIVHCDGGVHAVGAWTVAGAKQLVVTP